MISYLAGGGKVMNVKGLSVKFTGNVISSTAFGLDVNPYKDPDNEFSKSGSMIFDFNYFRGLEMFSIFFLPDIVHTLRLKVFGTKPTNFMRKTFWEVISMRMQSGQKRNDLIDILIDLKQNCNQNIDGFGK